MMISEGWRGDALLDSHVMNKAYDSFGTLGISPTAYLHIFSKLKRQFPMGIQHRRTPKYAI
jgi:Leu/Phe-tRNA-protein transferase